MMMRRQHRDDSAAGFTMVEVLVVLVILAIVGALVAASIVGGLRADAQARSRIEAFEDMQIAMERMSREIRGANPVVVAEDNRITVRVQRGDSCHDFTYQLTGQQITASEERFEDDCSTPTGSSGPIVLVQNIDLDANDQVDSVFTYWPEDRIDPIAPDGSGDPFEPAFVEITFVHPLALDQRPVTIGTVVGLRNR